MVVYIPAGYVVEFVAGLPAKVSMDLMYFILFHHLPSFFVPFDSGEMKKLFYSIVKHQNNGMTYLFLYASFQFFSFCYALFRSIRFTISKNSPSVLTLIV